MGMSWHFVLMVCMYLPSFIHLLADSYPAYSLVRCWSFIGPSMTPLIMWHYAKLMHCWCLAFESPGTGPMSETVSRHHNVNLGKISCDHPFILQFWTCQDSCAVVTRAKLLPYWIVIWHARVAHIFKRFVSSAHKPCVEWIPDASLGAIHTAIQLALPIIYMK